MTPYIGNATMNLSGNTKEKLKEFVIELNLDKTSYEVLMSVLEPLLHQIIQLEILSNLTDGEIKALENEGKTKGYDQERISQLIAFAFEKKSNKSILNIIDETVIYLIAEMINTKKILLENIEKAIKDPSEDKASLLENYLKELLDKDQQTLSNLVKENE